MTRQNRNRQIQKKASDGDWADDDWLGDAGIKADDLQKSRRSASRSRFALPPAGDPAAQRLLLFGIVIVIFIAALFGIWMCSSTSSESAPHNPDNGGDSALTIFNTPTAASDLPDTGYLLLVNHEYGLENIPQRDDMEDVYEILPANYEDVSLHPSASVALQLLFESAQDAGVGPFHIVSGFRDFDRQAVLYDRDQTGDFVLPAGHSEHHTGLAIDIVPTLQMRPGPLSEQLDGTTESERWLIDNAWRYGLILRYPEGKTDITGIAFEPWHFRYVGSPHAYYMWHYEIVLEEYLQLLRERGSLTIESSGRTYEVAYDPAIDGIVYLPSGMNFALSSDNRGGYVITAWER